MTPATAIARCPRPASRPSTTWLHLTRVCEPSAGAPYARSPAGIIAGPEIRAVAEEFRHVETFLDVGNQLLRRPGSRLQEIVAGTDARRASKSARSVACGLESQFFR